MLLKHFLFIITILTATSLCCQHSSDLGDFWKLPKCGEKCHKIFETKNRFSFRHFDDDDKPACDNKQPLKNNEFITLTSRRKKSWFTAEVSRCKRLKTGVYLKSFFLLIFNERAVMGIITILWILINTCRYTE